MQRSRSEQILHESACAWAALSAMRERRAQGKKILFTCQTIQSADQICQIYAFRTKIIHSSVPLHPVPPEKIRQHLSILAEVMGPGARAKRREHRWRTHNARMPPAASRLSPASYTACARHSRTRHAPSNTYAEPHAARRRLPGHSLTTSCQPRFALFLLPASRCPPLACRTRAHRTPCVEAHCFLLPATYASAHYPCPGLPPASCRPLPMPAPRPAACPACLTCSFATLSSACVPVLRDACAGRCAGSLRERAALALALGGRRLCECGMLHYTCNRCAARVRAAWAACARHRT
ncbi:hypothetical protein GGX14DRAFT_393606 [Mycena pura]|uniref:Uncharacterized protein n=1 Tax=Mycena pura TaxID=153505 RepID=A0AAD6YC23_9AGAR|nr:hypothetical protein GGX14DRAFT_393606 [Mycena pura]